MVVLLVQQMVVSVVVTMVEKWADMMVEWNYCCWSDEMKSDIHCAS